MKLKHIVALLGLTACVPAFAVDFVQNTAAQSVIGATPGSEATLQSIVDGLFGPGINVNTDQSSAGMFASSTPIVRAKIGAVWLMLSTKLMGSCSAAGGRPMGAPHAAPVIW